MITEVEHRAALRPWELAVSVWVAAVVSTTIDPSRALPILIVILFIEAAIIAVAATVAWKIVHTSSVRSSSVYLAHIFGILILFGGLSDLYSAIVGMSDFTAAVILSGVGVTVHIAFLLRQAVGNLRRPLRSRASNDDLETH